MINTHFVCLLFYLLSLPAGGSLLQPKENKNKTYSYRSVKYSGYIVCLIIEIESVLYKKIVSFPKMLMHVLKDHVYPCRSQRGNTPVRVINTTDRCVMMS